MSGGMAHGLPMQGNGVRTMAGDTEAWDGGISTQWREAGFRRRGSGYNSRKAALEPGDLGNESTAISALAGLVEPGAVAWTATVGLPADRGRLREYQRALAFAVVDQQGFEPDEGLVDVGQVIGVGAVEGFEPNVAGAFAAQGPAHVLDLLGRGDLVQPA